MIKKILLVSAISATCIFAEVSDIQIPTQNPIMQNKQTSNEQRTIKTKQDYIELESLLREIISRGAINKSLILGTLYMNSFKLDDGSVIKPNLAKAKDVFSYGVRNKIPMCSFYLSMLLENKQDALILLEENIKANTTQQSIREVLAIRYAEIVLSQFYKKDRFVSKALSLILPIANATNENPALDYTVAQLLFLDNQKSLATKYINSACNSPYATKPLLDKCFSDPNLVVNNKPNANKPRQKNECSISSYVND